VNEPDFMGSIMVFGEVGIGRWLSKRGFEGGEGFYG